ncbi:DUF7660 family protein [Uniformispora flossi]|uniref:DUF7660 family protein n=1 Tax=Uniformispora flossi TaxID=3390723 RepID=UPI003C303E6E
MVEPTEGAIGRAELADFIRDLRDEFIGNGSTWENPTVDRFLDALSAAWISDADGWYAARGEEVPERGDWAFFARALKAAADYE